tara:strand:+ start:1160 stop:1582 length:423 start_codon:yes stop_codon:yes gene_type:complete
MNLSKIKQVINNTIKRNVNDYLDKDNLKFDFKNKISLEDRKYQSKTIMEKYPNRLPIICNVSRNLPELDKHKYLIPDDLESTAFFFVIRKRLKLKESEAMYFFVNGKSLIANAYMSEIYNKYKDEDGFLYIYICAENTFG